MKKITIFTILLAFSLVFFAFQAEALTISPAKFILSANPGEIIETQMSVRNDQDRTATYYPDFQRYTTRGDEPVFIPEKTDLASWIETNPTQITLNSKETGNISVFIKIPEDAEPGGHYAAIFWSSAPPQKTGESGVSIVTRVGALVLLEISGNVVESGEIVSFKAEKTLFSRLPVSFSYDLKDTGTVHIGPGGKVVIKNIFGRTSAILEVNPLKYYVLPGMIRNFPTANWEPKGGMPKIEGEGFFTELKRELKGFALGYYRANLSLEYGKEEIKTLKAGFGFWVFPWRILIFVFLVLGILLLGLTKGIGAYNRWIINKVRASLDDKKKS